MGRSAARGRRVGGPLVDLGCGSGVLAIAAAKLGWDPVAGIDHELEAVQAARASAAVNGVDLRVRHGDLLRGGGPAPSATTVIANLTRSLLGRVARAGFDGAPPRALVAGGLLRAEAGEIAQAFEVHGLREHARSHGGGWVALTLVGRSASGEGGLI